MHSDPDDFVTVSVFHWRKMKDNWTCSTATRQTNVVSQMCPWMWRLGATATQRPTIELCVFLFWCMCEFNCELSHGPQQATVCLIRQLSSTSGSLSRMRCLDLWADWAFPFITFSRQERQWEGKKRWRWPCIISAHAGLTMWCTCRDVTKTQ